MTLDGAHVFRALNTLYKRIGKRWGTSPMRIQSDTEIKSVDLECGGVVLFVVDEG